MQSNYMTITPEMAQAWLNTSPGNPRWTKGNKLVDREFCRIIANDIKSGNWHPGTNPIAFDEEGRLIDGHHRLTAVVLAGCPVQSFVVYSVPPMSANHIDDSRARTVSMRPKINNTVVSAVNCHFKMMGLQTGNRSESVEVILNFYQRHPLLQEAFKLCCLGSDKPIFKKASMVYAIFCALETGISEGVISDFCKAVNSGFIEDRGESGAIVLRNMILSKQLECRSNSERVKSICATQQALFDYINKVPRRKVYTGKESVFFTQLVQSRREDFAY